MRRLPGRRSSLLSSLGRIPGDGACVSPGPHAVVVWLGCPNSAQILRPDAVSTVAQGLNRVHERIPVPTLFMPSPTERHYNTNFTHFEAPAPFCAMSRLGRCLKARYCC